MIIRNTFLNAQMGQIVQYGQMSQKNRQRTLKWIDQKDQTKNDGLVSEDPPPAAQKQNLAKLIPIQDTVKFDKRVDNHHNKT